jgi:excinuclease ABC subunit B
VNRLGEGAYLQTLRGATGTGKTFTMANVINEVQRPTLVLAPNRTLAAQLAQEFRDFFPENSVEYFVSYYDYYQPEAYLPRTDTYIAKDADVNEEIDKMRHAATYSLLERTDTIVVASVSCIYGLAPPSEYQSFVVRLMKGKSSSIHNLIRQLVAMQYHRNDMTLLRGTFRVRGDTLTVFPAYGELALRIDFWGDVIEEITSLDPLTGEIIDRLESEAVYPAKHFVTSQEKLEDAMLEIEKELESQLKYFRSQGKLLEAQRLSERTQYDLETMREIGYCPGIENYSRHLAGRSEGSRPWTLLDYFPEDWLLFVDESHMSLPQVRGMFLGDTSRKKTLVEHGFRLPSAIDNRPLNFDEFFSHIHQAIFVSATPGPFELENCAETVEQVIRPTGILDPRIEIRETTGQIDDLLAEIQVRVNRSERTLVTTLTKRMSEDLNEYLKDSGVRSTYLHSEVDTLQRVEILRDLRLGIYDVIVGINLLREGLDLPEVSLICILDADKEGYLRSAGALVQTMGRAARHPDGFIIMYADRITRSMETAISETDARRQIQMAHNNANGITPEGIAKNIKDISDRIREEIKTEEGPFAYEDIPSDELEHIVRDLELQMKQAASDLEFERAALIRDQITQLKLENTRRTNIPKGLSKISK